MKNSIKREQSQACLNFAERKNFRLQAKYKILMTLALLLTAVTGAWAADPKVYTEPVAISSLHVGDILATGFLLTPASNLDVIYFDANRFKQDNSPMGSQWGVSLSYINSYGENAAMTFRTPSDPPSDLTATPVDASGNDGNAWVVTLVGNTQGTYTIRLSGTYYDPPIEVNEVNPVTVSGATKQWEFDMPASDVLLTPVYAPVAAFAVENAGTANEKTLLPEAAEGVIAGQDADIVTAGQSAQGTVMYAVTTSAEAAPALTAFSDAVPNAKDYDDAATVYVWYYIQGADTPDGQEATEENTFNDSEICATPLTVQVLTNKFDLTLKAANVNTIDATQASKGTVSVAGTDKTGEITDEGKLTAIKMGSEVKLKANTGYKFRKVEVKKKASTPTLKDALADGATVVITYTWMSGTNVTTFTYTNNGGNYTGSTTGDDAEYFANDMSKEGTTLKFTASNPDHSAAADVSIDFDTDTNEYVASKGGYFTSFTISVNGTDLTSQLTEVK